MNQIARNLTDSVEGLLTGERSRREIVRSIKESCLERLILFGESSLRTAVQNFMARYHSERNHQGLDNRIIQPERAEALQLMFLAG